VTGDGEQEEQAAELARQAEAVQEQGMPIFRTVQEFVGDAKAAEDAAGPVFAVAHQTAEALDLRIAEVIAAVRALPGFDRWQPAAALSGEGTLIASGRVLAGASLTAEARIFASADVITASERESTVKQEDIADLSAKASRDGVAGLSPIQVFTLVLLWLLTLGAPVVQELVLPPEAQTVVSNEYATFGIGLAITLVILQNRTR
jgi:hypothetical protein